MEKMKLSDRARIFLPFDSLKGFRDALKEQEKTKCERKILSDEQKEEINLQLQKVRKGDLVKITTYLQDEETYIDVEGIITRIDELNHLVYIVKEKYDINDIIFISIYDENMDI